MIGETWERLKEALNGWSGLMAAIALVSPWASAVVAWAAGHSNIAKYLVAAGCAVMFSTPLVVAATAMVVRRMPWRGYKVKSVRRVYEFDTADPSVQRATWERTIVLLNSATKVIDFNYQWTGKGPRDTPTVEPLSCRVLDMDALDARDHHLVLLGNGFPTRQEQVVVLRQTYHDPEFTMKTFMSMSARRRFGRLAQRITFSIAKPPLEGSVFYVISDIRTERCVARREMAIQYENDGRPFVEADEAKPRPGMDYKIEWTWPGA